MNHFPMIIGPCVIESHEWALDVTREIQHQLRELPVEWTFKASFDKANRSSVKSFRGPGLESGLKTLSEVQNLGIPVLTDVHETGQVKAVAEVVDCIQVPAFLCRQTDLIEAVVWEAFSRNKKINIKKGQFLAPWDVKNIVDKVKSFQKQFEADGELWITERGVSFGYNRLIVDMAAFREIQAFNVPVIYDATHSVQLPGASQGGQATGGTRENIRVLARAAVAAGANGLFMEVHPDPKSAKSDGPNAFHLNELRSFVSELLEIQHCVSRFQ